MPSILVYLGLGSNVGDREAQLRTALAALAGAPGVTDVRCSPFVESELVGAGPPQGPFLNAVCELRTTLPPDALLALCKQLERGAGRELPAPRNHPRPLDLDLIAWGDQEIDTRDLVVPHPQWRDREFVTGPLRELGADSASWPRSKRPRILHSPAEFAARCSTWLAGDCRVGLVPTMGALHDGHLSLIERARAECDRVAVTVFVNPLQFGAGEDLEAYPRTLERDVEVCRGAGADAVFAPAPAAMYPEGFASRVTVGAEAEGMEGAVRPEHFTGVATVVAKLFAIARPHRAYFGEKDAQQLAVIRRLVRDLGFPVEIVPCPIVREPDGLAMSSRNVYLEASDRAASTVLFRALSAARAAFRDGETDRDRLIAATTTVLEAESGVTIDYVELRREGDLAELPAGPVTGGRMLVAARLLRGARPVRLIDNLAFGAAAEADS